MSKRITKADASEESSNQHEIGALKKIMGETHQEFTSRVKSWKSLGMQNSAWNTNNKFTYYDNRANNPVRSPQWMLYYESGLIIKEGEVLIVIKDNLGNEPNFKFIIVPEDHAMFKKYTQAIAQFHFNTVIETNLDLFELR